MFSPIYSKIKLFSILVLLFFTPKILPAQDIKVTRDLKLWTEVKLEKKFLEDFSVGLSQHLRLNRNFTSFDDYIFDLGLQYKINKNFGIGTSGRYTRNKKYNGTVNNDYRYDLDFRYDANLTPKLKFYYRLRFQKEFYNLSVLNKSINLYETVFRNRLKFGWKANETHRIYVSSEIFRKTKRLREPFFSEYRIFLGDDFSPGFGELDLAIGYEEQLNNKNCYRYCIFKIKYQLEM